MRWWCVTLSAPVSLTIPSIRLWVWLLSRRLHQWPEIEVRRVIWTLILNFLTGGFGRNRDCLIGNNYWPHEGYIWAARPFLIAWYFIQNNWFLLIPIHLFSGQTQKTHDVRSPHRSHITQFFNDWTTGERRNGISGMDPSSRGRIFWQNGCLLPEWAQLWVRMTENTTRVTTRETNATEWTAGKDEDGKEVFVVSVFLLLDLNSGDCFLSSSFSPSLEDMEREWRLALMLFLRKGTKRR